ncbi:MAG TPA: hypothetical protein VEJ42_06515 [Streptosporangiaceae bacterium]|nr:hypothetical protein [Streptosporangiaceae bacterium]
MESIDECAFCGRTWVPGVVRRTREHVWSEWIRKQAGQLPNESWHGSLGLVGHADGSYSDAPLRVIRNKRSVLNQVTREVCKNCNWTLGRTLEEPVKPLFIALAQAAQSGDPLTIAHGDASTLARWAEKMAITNELASGASERVATTAMGQAILAGQTIRGSVVWAARHPADYMLLTALAQPAIGASALPVPGEIERRAAITAITYHYLTLLVFIPGPGLGLLPPSPLFVSLDRWATIWPVAGDAEFAPTLTVNGRELERTLTDYSNWLLSPPGLRNIRPAMLPPTVIQRN